MLIARQRHKLQADPRGKITTGKKREGADQGQALEYFNLDPTTNNATGFPELKKMYGDKPTKILVVMPGELMDVFNEAFERWGKPKSATQGEKGSKISECNGETCRVRIPFAIGSENYEAGSMPCICKRLCLRHFPHEDPPYELEENKEMLKRACRYGMYLTVWVANTETEKIESLVPYCFRNGSLNSGASVRSALEDMSAFTHSIYGEARIRFMKFWLSVQMREGRDDPKQKFPIWEMHVAEVVGEIKGRISKMSEAMGWRKQLEETATPPVISMPATMMDQEEQEPEDEEEHSDDIFHQTLDANQKRAREAKRRQQDETRENRS